MKQCCKTIAGPDIRFNLLAGRHLLYSVEKPYRFKILKQQQHHLLPVREMTSQKPDDLLPSAICCAYSRIAQTIRPARSVTFAGTDMKRRKQTSNSSCCPLRPISKRAICKRGRLQEPLFEARREGYATGQMGREARHDREG